MTIHTYIVEGGIGKCVAFSSLTGGLRAKAEEPIQIHTPYYEVFAGNPDVRMVYDSNTVPLHVDQIKSSDLIEYAEPYKSNFIKGDHHLIDAYCRLHGIEFSLDMTPKIYTDHLAETAKKFLSDNKISKYIMVQFTGGQSPLGGAQGHYHSINEGRNYPAYFAQGVVDKLATKYPEHTIIDCSLPNEPMYKGAMKYSGTWPVLHELMKNADGYIGVDSLLNHLSASAMRSGVVIWGNTNWVNYGYTHNCNISFHDSVPYNDPKQEDLNNPRNAMIDPDRVMEIFDSSVYGIKVKSYEVQVPSRSL